MITINHHSEIDALLKTIDAEATKAINSGKNFTAKWTDNNITNNQFNAMHVWIRQCANYLNEIGMYRLSPVSGKKIPWTEIAFKEDVYKVVLKALADKDSTKEQTTKNPNDIRLAISGHMATAYKENILLPEWPSLR